MAKESWVVTGQSTDQLKEDSAGRVIVGTYIYFTTGEGNDGSVFLPDAHRSRENAHKMLMVAAKRLDEIGGLSHNWNPDA
jgi:hypothetical protein